MQNKLFYRGIFLALFWALFLFYWTSLVQADTPTSPFQGGCVGVFPIDEEFCGCTQGYVYYQGEPITGTKVTLAFEDQVLNTYTMTDTNSVYDKMYELSGYDLGAKRNDIMTLTAEYAGQTITRSFRAWPDDAVQKVDLILNPGHWETWSSDGYTSTLTALDSQTVLAGGHDGLLQIDLATDQQTQHDLPWSERRVRDVAVDNQQRIWASGDGGLAIYNNGTWETPAIPLNDDPIHRLAITPDGSRAWASDNSAQGNLIFFDGTSWSQQEAIGDYVMDLVLDDDQTLWAATWQSGLVSITSNGQRTTYTTQDGLTNNRIYSLLIAPKPALEIGQAPTDVLWFGTQAVASSDNPQGDSLGFYDFTTDEWVTYDAGIPNLQAVRSLAIDPSGLLWAGTDNGPYFLQTDNPDAEEWTRQPDWRSHPQWEDAELDHLLTMPNMVIVATDAGLSRLVFEAPTESLPQPIIPPGLEMIRDSQLNLSASASASNWYWFSDIDGPLCTTDTVCQLPISRLSSGSHRITLQVQDQTGRRSSMVEFDNLVEVSDIEIYNLYLPTIVR